MATSTQGTVISLIVAKIQALDLSSLIGGAPCPVFDGPNGTDEENNFVVVHAWPGQNSAQTASWVGLGARAMNENYDVCIAIWCYDGGISPPGGSGSADPQQTVRSNCTAIAAAIEQALKDDIDLAIQNGGIPPAYPFWTEVAQQPLSQELPESANGMGVFAAINMRVHCFARILT